VRRAVDSASEARHDDEVVLAEIVREAAREPAGRGRGIARADDRHGLLVQQVQIAFRNQQRRRVLELGKQPRVEAPPQCQPLRTEFVDPGDFALGIVAAAQWRHLAPAAPRKVGHCRERGGGRPEASDQLAVGDGPDARASDQP
jgi:hypothetical protein